MTLTIGERIKIFRERAEMTQEELAAAVFKSRVTVCHWEIGRSAVKSHDVTRLCKALRIDPNALFEFN